MSLQNPLNVILFPPILYLISLIFYPPHPPAKELPRESDPNTYNWLPLNHPDVLVHKRYSPKQLVKYDGKDGGRILLAIKNVASGKGERTVFDVSSGRSFYGPDGVYGNFAGRDASRGMAKQSFDDDMISSLEAPIDDLKDLTASEIDNMKGWHEHFSRKYTICGELVEEGEDDN